MLKRYHPDASILRNDIARVAIDEQVAERDPEYTRVHNALADCYINRDKRYRLYYGSHSDGKVWLEDEEVLGYVSVSSGASYKRCFILVTNKNAYSGSAIVPHMVLGVQEVKSKKFLYKHPLFHFPQLTVDDCDVFDKKGIVAHCATPEKAEHLKQFYLGQRMTKA